MGALALKPLDWESKPHVPPYVRLQFDPVRQKHCIIGPDGVLWPDALELAIFRQCNGRQRVADITVLLAQQAPVSGQDFELHVYRTIQAWVSQRLLRA
jgi:pyrroloquinoline quinone biosynthesis protein D